MKWLLYFGRLEKEKWFDALIEMIEINTKNNNEFPYELFILAQEAEQKKLKNSQVDIRISIFSDEKTWQRSKDT